MTNSTFCIKIPFPGLDTDASKEPYLLDAEPGLLILGLLHCSSAGLASVGGQRLELDVVPGVLGGRGLVGVTHHCSTSARVKGLQEYSSVKGGEQTGMAGEDGVALMAGR